MKKWLLMILIFGITVITVLSGCNTAKSQQQSALKQETQNNSPLLEVPAQSANENIDKISDSTSSSKQSSNNLQRNSEEGEVSFNVTFANPLGEQKEGYLSFIVLLNTHSVDLNRYPLNKSAKLYDGKGNILADQSEWDIEGDSHHLVGKLNFKTKQSLNNIDGLKLVVENYGGAAKREFTWDKQAIVS